MSKTREQKTDTRNLIIFLILCLIVGIGWLFGFTSKRSYIFQQIGETALWMKIIAFAILGIGGYFTYLFATGKKGTGDATKDWIPVVITLGLTVLFFILFMMGFGNSFR